MKNNKVIYKEFIFGDLIDEIYKGHAYTKDELQISDINETNTIRYITRTELDNGCDCRVKNENLDFIEKKNAITVGDTTATCFYQNEDFITGDHMIIVRAKWMNKYTAIYILTLLRLEKYRYSYGRAYLLNLVQNTKLRLPAKVIKNGKKSSIEPDWKYIEEFIKNLKNNNITTKEKCSNKLNIKTFKEYKVGEIFENIKIDKLSSIPDEEGDINFISSTSINNGVSKKVAGNPIKGNCITVSTNGDCFDCFYHKDDIIVSSDVEVLYSDKLNVFNALYICTILKLEKFKWSYGRKPKDNKVFNTIIKLPANKNGSPDWDGMEQFVKNLKYADKL